MVNLRANLIALSKCFPLRERPIINGVNIESGLAISLNLSANSTGS